MGGGGVQLSFTIYIQTVVIVKNLLFLLQYDQNHYCFCEVHNK